MESNGKTPNMSRHMYHQGFPLQQDAEISLFHRLMRGRVGLVLFSLLSISLALLPIIFISWPVFIFMLTGFPVSRNGCRRFVNWAFGVWLYMESYFMENLLGIRTRVFGHPTEFNDKCIVMMNHRCHFDWMFFFPIICKQGNPKKWLAVLKYAGKRFPVLGWAMQMRNFLFMSRRWAKDEVELKWKLNYLKFTNSDYQILMFPEGTDLNPVSCLKSDKFAEENDYVKYDYVLHPKTTGFKYTLKTLREQKIESIYDLTVGYPDIFAPTEVEMFRDGRIPREIHYHIQRHDISSLPNTDEKIDEWIRQRWREKEERLRLFYTHRRFHDLPLDHQSSSSSSNGSSFSLSPEIRKPLQAGQVVFSLSFCVFNLFLLGYLCWKYWFMATIGGTLLSLMVYITMFTGGIDYLVMKALNDKQFRQTVQSTDAGNKKE